MRKGAITSAALKQIGPNLIDAHKIKDSCACAAKKSQIIALAVSVFMTGTRLQMREAYLSPILGKSGTYWRAPISFACSCSVAVVSLFFLISSLT
jgi:redox-regulated HSP33 family molecular chaperone